MPDWLKHMYNSAYKYLSSGGKRLVQQFLALVFIVVLFTRAISYIQEHTQTDSVGSLQLFIQYVFLGIGLVFLFKYTILRQNPYALFFSAFLTLVFILPVLLRLGKEIKNEFIDLNTKKEHSVTEKESDKNSKKVDMDELKNISHTPVPFPQQHKEKEYVSIKLLYPDLFDQNPNQVKVFIDMKPAILIDVNKLGATLEVSKGEHIIHLVLKKDTCTVIKQMFKESEMISSFNCFN